MEFVIKSAKELADNLDRSRYGTIIGLLEDALVRLYAGDGEAAVWRVADAGLLLRRKIELHGDTGCLTPSGRGAELPVGPKPVVVK